MPTRASTEAAQLLTLSGVATSAESLAELVAVASADMFVVARGGAAADVAGGREPDAASLVARAVAVARVVRFAATIGGAVADRMRDPATAAFWDGLLTSLRALHVAVASTSAARECVATVRIFAVAAFKARRGVAQFLFGPIVNHARRQYELGSAMGNISGSTRAIVDLVATLTSQANEGNAVSALMREGAAHHSSAIALPVEQLAFLADAADAVAHNRPWADIAALATSSSAATVTCAVDTVDAATVRRNGDGVAWDVVAPRRTKQDIEAEAGNMVGAKEQPARLEGRTLFCGTVVSTMAPFVAGSGGSAARYFEVAFPRESVRVAVGWTAKTAEELRKLRRTHLIRETHTADTVTFDGHTIVHGGSYTVYGWSGTGDGDVCGASIRASADGKKVVLRWSINGEVFPDFELPKAMQGKPLRAFVQISRSDGGMRLAASGEMCRFLPRGFAALHANDQAAMDYDSQKRRADDTAASVAAFEAAAKELADFLQESAAQSNNAAASPGKPPAA